MLLSGSRVYKFSQAGFDGGAAHDVISLHSSNFEQQPFSPVSFNVFFKQYKGLPVKWHLSLLAVILGLPDSLRDRFATPRAERCCF